MDFVHEQHIAWFQIGEQRRQITRSFDHRPGGGTQRHAQLVGQDMRQGGLAQPGRPEYQRMVQCFLALPRSAHEDFHLRADLGLAHVFGQGAGPHRALEAGFLARLADR